MKNFKLQGILLIVAGVAVQLLRIVMPQMRQGVWNIYLMAMSAVLIVVGIVLLVLGVRKKKKDAEKENTSAVKTEEHKELVVPPLPKDFEIYIEKDGKNLHDIFNQGEKVSTVDLVTPEDKVVSFDYLWYKNYGEHAFCVLGLDCKEDDGSTQYCKFPFRIIESKDGETGLVLEEDEGVVEFIKKEFDTAVEEYAKAQSGQSSQTSGSISVSYEDKGRIKNFIALSAVYLIVLIVGLVGKFTAFGITNEATAAICGAICLSYAVITPSYFIYLSTSNPFNFGNVVCKIIKWVAVAVMIVLAIINITALPDGIDYEGFWGFFMHIFIPAVPFVATFCYYAVYCWWCNDAPSKIYLIFGIAVTLLFPVATALLIAYFIIVTLIAAIKWLLSCLGIMVGDTNFGKGFISGWTGKSFEKTYTIRDENGYEHTVKSSDGIHFYGDGQNYISDDGGNTLRKD